MFMRKTLYSNIHAIERDIERIKTLHHLRKMTHDAAKQEIIRLEAELLHHVNLLPEYERQIYLLRKEFGKEY